jgi:Protein of unknown function (DUF1559)
MPNPVSIREAPEQAGHHAAAVIPCPICLPPFDGLPRWPESAHAMLAGAHQARPDDDDGKFADRPHAGKKGKNYDDDEDDSDEDRPLPKKRTSASSGAGAAAAGIGVGMILLIVGGVAACCVCVPGILVALLVPAVQKVREAAARTQAINNAKEIGLACHNHFDRFKTLPSPRMQPQFPQNISPELSWRVSILPFVAQQGLFNDFDKNQAWDGPRNQAFVNRMPPVYGSPLDPETVSQTKFQYFTGPNTLFPEPLSKVSIATIPDGSSNTFLFAEAVTPVPWSKPADMVVGIGPLPLPEGKFIAGMADATVRMIDRRKTSDQTLRLAINPADGQPLPADWDR